ncbi:MAG: cation:proton antiporter domain-containing protein [Planctomycetota bacterium]
MINSLVNASAETFGYLNPVLLFGLVILGGAFGARLFQKFHIPQVVGCIVVGILFGDVFKLITPQTIETLRPFTMFALGMIGFMIGAELRADVFKKYGKQFFIILFSEGIGAFLLVAVGTSLVAWLVIGNLYISIAMGLVLGAISSATAPAATVNVLWEYKTRGPLTAAVLAIVALDDALALLLFRGAATGAKALMGTAGGSALRTTLVLIGEITGAILLGILAGVLFYYLLKLVRDDDKILGFSISCLLLVVGISMIADIGPILPAMTLGVTVANLMPRRSKATFKLVENFSPPIYFSFFVLAGAHIEFGRLATWVVVMIVAYILCRVGGKVAGAWFGARYSGAPAVIRKYLGICLQSQAGVAIGLAILSVQLFNAELGKIIIMVVMTATFATEILGPILVKVGVKKAGEIGLNITEEDLIKTYKVGDVMDSKPTNIVQDLPLGQILEVFSTSDSVYYPVIDSQSRIVGIITIADIKEMFANRDVAGWLLACDVAEQVMDKTTPDKPLEEAMERMRRYDLEYMPVIAGDGSDKLVGVLDYRMVNRKISAEVLHKRKTADEATLATG